MKRAALALAALAAAAFGSVPPAAAQTWPSRPIHLVVGFGPGGGTDIIARIVAQPLSEALGQPIVVDNKVGAGGTIGADAVAKAAPDGHTMFMMNNGHAVSAVLYKSLPYDSVRDFQPAAMVATMPLVLVAGPRLAADDLGGLVALARQRPGEINFASVGIGSSQHFAGELLRQLTGIDIVHIPYRGTPNAIAAVRSGEVQLLVETAAPVLGQIRAGDLRALAVTPRARFEGLPDTPTVAEAGVADYDVTTWYALAFPARTPAPIVARLNETVAAVLQSDAVRRQMLAAAFVPASVGTPQGLTAHLEGEIAKWGAVMRAAGIEQQ